MSRILRVSVDRNMKLLFLLMTRGDVFPAPELLVAYEEEVRYFLTTFKSYLAELNPRTGS